MSIQNRVVKVNHIRDFEGRIMDEDSKHVRYQVRASDFQTGALAVDYTVKAPVK